MLLSLFSPSLSFSRNRYQLPPWLRGDELWPINYRPISLTSSVSKVWKRVVCDQLLHFALTHHIKRRKQHGFIPGRSTMTNLLYCLNDWTSCLDQGSIPVDYCTLTFPRRLLSKEVRCSCRLRLSSPIECGNAGCSFI